MDKKTMIWFMELLNQISFNQLTLCCVKVVHKMAVRLGALWPWTVVHSAARFSAGPGHAADVISGDDRFVHVRCVVIDGGRVHDAECLTVKGQDDGAGFQVVHVTSAGVAVDTFLKWKLSHTHSERATAMMELSTALSGAKTLFEVARAAMDARDDAKLKSAMTELHGKLYDATQAAMESAFQSAALQEVLLAAQNECAELKRKAAERERYAIAQIPGQGKVYAYARKPTQDGDEEPTHYLCQPCYDKGIKSVLQPSKFHGGMEYLCTCCKTKLFS
jgi:hypothetical protein